MAEQVLAQNVALTVPLQAFGTGLSTTTDLAKQVKSNLRRILGVRCRVPGQSGELPWDGSFGSALYRLKHRNIDSPTTKALAHHLVVDKITQYEPRVVLRQVDIGRGDQANSLAIRLSYDVVDRGRVVAGPVTLSVEL